MTEWACLLSGMLWVALSTRSSTAELREILEDATPRVLIVDASTREAAIGAGPAAATVLIETATTAWSELLATTADTGEFPDAAAPVRIRYTSGTSGRAKGAVITGEGYAASVEAVNDVIAPVERDDVLVQAAPMTHAAGALLLPHLAAGARAVLLDRFDADAFAETVAAHSATTVFLVPTMLVRVLELSEPERLRSLRTIVYGGAPMPTDRLVAGIDRYGQIFVQIYGLTESTWPVTALRREEHPLGGDEEQRAARLRSCGKPTSVGEVRIVARDGATLRAGEAGELVVRGRNTMVGYWAGPDCRPVATLDSAVVDRVDTTAATKGLDAGGWMHTGDIAVIDTQGFVTIIDRMHDMIVSGGFNIYPADVEAALSTHPAVLESAVVGLPDPDWGERVHADVVLRPGARVDREELIEHTTARIARFKKPRTLRVVSALPKNASGKILRREVRRALTLNK